MKTRGIIGQRIKRIVQRYIPDDRGNSVPGHMRTDGIILEDGSHLYFSVHETDGDYDVEMHHHPKSKRKNRAN